MTQRFLLNRYAANRVSREQRICTLCVLREIEDDFHFVIKCYESDSSNGASVLYYIDIYLYNVNVGQCLI